MWIISFIDHSPVCRYTVRLGEEASPPYGTGHNIMIGFVKENPFSIYMCSSPDARFILLFSWKYSDGREALIHPGSTTPDPCEYCHYSKLPSKYK